MRVDVFLAELMDKPTEWDWGYWVHRAIGPAHIQPQPSPTGFARSHYSAAFAVETNDGQTLSYEVEFQQVLRRWKVDFALVQGNQKVRKLQQFGDARVGARVITTVVAILDEFISQTNRPEIMFYAMRSEPSRVKLYDALSKRITAKYGYRLKRTEDEEAVSYFFLHQSEQTDLQESFDNPYRWQWTTRTPQQYVATFDADGNMVIVEITDDAKVARLQDGDDHDPNLPGDGTWDVLFSVKTERGRQSLDVMHWGNQTKAQRILATVVEIMATFTKTTREPIRVIKFLSMTGSRSRLYARMIQRYIAQELPQFHLRSEVDGGSTLFVLTNTQARQIP